MQFIAFANQPKQQAELVKRMPYGPVNRKALSLLEPAMLNDMSSSPQNIAKQSVSDGQYWAKPADADRNAELAEEVVLDSGLVPPCTRGEVVPGSALPADGRAPRRTTPR